MKAIKTLFFFLIISFFVFVYYSADVKKYGVTWDEFFHRPTGKMYTKFLKSGDLSEIMNDPHSAWLPPLSSSIGYLFQSNKTLEKFLPAETERFHMGAVFFASVTSGLIFIFMYII